jgi:hypothetical protein
VKLYNLDIIISSELKRLKHILRKLERLRTAIIQIGDNEYTAESQIDIEVKNLVKLLT